MLAQHRRQRPRAKPADPSLQRTVHPASVASGSFWFFVALRLYGTGTEFYDQTWPRRGEAEVKSDPSHFRRPGFRPQFASPCAIAINDFVQLPNEPEKSSIAVLSPRLSFETSPSSFSAVGFLLGKVASVLRLVWFKRPPVSREWTNQIGCKSFTAICFAQFKGPLLNKLDWVFC